MSENPSASEWATGRGEKWRAQLDPMEAMMAPVDGPLIDGLALDAPCRIADIGCGGGGTSIEIARRAPAGSVVHGFDISPLLVEAAQARAVPGGSELSFHIADVTQAALPEPKYDRLVSRFGTMFYDDPPAAFASLCQWLVPGGRFAFAVWGPPAGNAWMKDLRDTIAEYVDAPKPDPDAPGPFRYADAEKLVDLLANAGFANIAVEGWRDEMLLGGGMDAQDAVDFALASFSVGELLEKADEETKATARKALVEQLGGHERDGAVRMGAHVHILTGARAT